MTTLSLISADSLVLPVYCTLTKILYLIPHRIFHHFAACTVNENYISYRFHILKQSIVLEKKGLKTVDLSF